MAAPITKTDAYLTIRARRIKIGKTFNISASAIDQHPTKIPARKEKEIDVGKGGGIHGTGG